jgi:hypothetical protein
MDTTVNQQRNSKFEYYADSQFSFVFLFTIFKGNTVSIRTAQADAND